MLTIIKHWGIVITTFTTDSPHIYHSVNTAETNDTWQLLVLSSDAAETLLRNPLILLLCKLCPIGATRGTQEDDRQKDTAMQENLTIELQDHHGMIMGAEDDQGECKDGSLQELSRIDASLRSVSIDVPSALHDGSTETFSCRTWVRDALVALHMHGCISFDARQVIDGVWQWQRMQEKLFEIAIEVEAGPRRRSAKVVDDGVWRSNND